MAGAGLVVGIGGVMATALKGPFGWTLGQVTYGTEHGEKASSWEYNTAQLLTGSMDWDIIVEHPVSAPYHIAKNGSAADSSNVSLLSIGLVVPRGYTADAGFRFGIGSRARIPHRKMGTR